MQRDMFRRFRGLAWTLAAAAVALVAPAVVVGEPTLTAPALEPAAGASASADRLAPQDSQESPTLAPPRRNMLREPAKPSVASEIPSPIEKSDSPAPALQSAMPSTLPAAPAASPDTPATPQTAAAPLSPAPAAKDDSLKPVPENLPADAIETASFNGVTPGKTTMAEVEKQWGLPQQKQDQGETVAHLYKVEPFEHVEVIFHQSKVASIVIRLAKVFPADPLAKQLAMEGVQPVLIANDLGEILGQAYPERGVLFSFEPASGPGKATMKVSQIILEPVTAEPFLLRAETRLDAEYEASLKDLEHALKLAPNNAKAHWLKARLLVLMDKPEEAVAAAAQAIAQSPSEPQYRLTRAQVLGQVGRFADAMKDAESAIATSENKPHLLARAQCLMGDLLGSGPQPDYKKALEFHTQAIKTADPLATAPHPAIRLPAKEVLIDAHLGAAHDIAWGTWGQKETAVPVWLNRAMAFADELIQNDNGTPEHRFRVATRALAACVGGQGKVDPAEWTEQAVRLGDELIAAVGNAPQKKHIQWELGMALYDAVQIYQMRNQPDDALKHGEKAIAYLTSAGGQDSPADAYLLGRLYFRLGSIEAIGRKDHKAAVVWFEKAVPVLGQASTQVAPFELGRLGETLVSIAVSYWETGNRDNAMQLTQQGVELMEKAVAQGQLAPQSLNVPYTNLATMHRQLGQDAQAQKYIEKMSAGRPNQGVRR